MPRQTLTLILALLAVLSVHAQYITLDTPHVLFRRDGKLPFDILPNTQCAAPAACSNIAQPYSCRCSGLLTVCKNEKQFCWGSMTLNQTSGCPAVPETCSAQLKSTPSCLCNSTTVLCVDSSSQYCYGTFPANTPSPQVSLAQLPSDSQPSSTAQPKEEGRASTTTSVSLLLTVMAMAAATIIAF